MKVVFEVDKKSLALAKAVLLQSADDDEEKEKEIESACSKCEGDVVVEVSAADVGTEHAKQLSLGLALIAIWKMGYE